MNGALNMISFFPYNIWPLREKQADILFDTSFEDIEDIKTYYYEDGKSGATCVTMLGL